MDSALLLDTLDKRIVDLEQELLEAQTAARVLRKMLSTPGPLLYRAAGDQAVNRLQALAGKTASPGIRAAEVVKIDRDAANAVTADGKLKRGALSGWVNKAVQAMGDSEFVGPHIAEWIATKADGEAMPEDLKSKVATVLSRLTDRGILERTVTGGGNVPHKYRRVAATLPDASADDEEESPTVG